MSDLNCIMHVDDDQDILEIARVALSVIDQFCLHQHSSGQQALDALGDTKPDLLLLDVMMPGMTGPDLWKKVREAPENADIPAIFMTAMAEEAMANDLIEGGALAVITKPFDPMQLGQEIRRAWANA